jgi:carbamoyl-phosphate synthase large subunit
MRIAVTATGGGVGQSIIKALKGHHDVIALNSDRLGAGLYMVEESYLIPQANDPHFIDDVLDVCLGAEIDVLFPGMDCELGVFSESRDLFLSKGIDLVVSDKNVIDIADDKLLTQEFLKDNLLPYLETSDKFRYILKEKKGGARSRGVVDISYRDYSNYVAQEYVDGDEYTCGTVTLGGVFRGCIIMRRELRDGDTYKAFVEKNDAIESICKKICNTLNPYGAMNIQLRLRDGVPYVFELNARCSGTTGARALAGFNEPLMIAHYIEHGVVPKYDIKEISILRYWQELVVKNEDIINE